MNDAYKIRNLSSVIVRERVVVKRAVVGHQKHPMGDSHIKVTGVIVGNFEKNP